MILLAKNKKTTRLKFDIAGVLSILAAVYIYICIFDRNSGLAGGYIKKILFGTFGIGSYFFPLLILIFGVAAFYLKDKMKLNIKFYSFCLAFITLLMLLYLINIKIFQEAALDYIESIIAAYELGTQSIGGGIIGTALGYIMVKVFGTKNIS